MSMKRMIIVFLMVFCFLGTGFAQESNKVGIGVALIDLLQFAMSNAVGVNSGIVVPIVTSPTFRLEPEIGYYSATEKDEDGTTEESNSTSWRIGLGIFPQKTMGDFTLYYGGRIGYMNLTETYESGTYRYEENVSGFYIAPAVGGEHNFSDHFSIGGEVQLMYATLDGDNNQNDDTVSLSLFTTRVLGFFRFYF